MNSNSSLLALMLALSPVAFAHAQGTFLYDQQSAFDDTSLGEAAIAIMANRPFGQSFTPSLSSVDFISLQLYGGSSATGPGTTLAINLRSGSINGPLLASTEPVFLLNGSFTGFITFRFATRVPVNPGVTYYFEPLVQSGDWAVGAYNPGYNYPGGTEIYRGTALPGSDLLFREGIIVPEPSSASLLLLAGGLLYLRRTRPHGPAL
jgi:hypothetical protein